MATSGQDQVDVRLARRPAEDWTEEDVAHFLKDMDLCDSVIETFKGKRNISNFLSTTHEACNIFAERKVNGKTLLQSQWTKADLSPWKR